ncbi:MAG: peptide ABC transporter substrate-binding protein [Chloroflexi bacterium]|nr:peptide ABC transporter substrate-binding protein [Chloroflexota bacterium]MBV9132558.1 peptide ABC transporter substrate-binding protein [Chloroflexota bacterium]MBV9894595.1 peptide ABC transporter substrate-binding protein [Chloroflexota bacterium]
MRRSLYVLSAWTLLVAAACGPAAAPAATPAPTPAAAAKPTTAPAAAPTTAPAGAATTAPAAPAPTVAPTAAAKPAAGGAGRGAGGMLHILYWQAPTILNTHLAQGTKDYDAGRLVLEPLASMGPDGKPVLNLAAELPTIDNGGVSKDQKSITWKLRQDVKWSDGTPFTSDDVVFTYQYIANPDVASSDTQTIEGVDTVKALDQYTVQVTYKDSNPNPYQMFVSGYGNIIQKKQFEAYNGANAKDAPGNLAPIGTGPYKVVDFKPGDVVTYTINDNYRDPNKPYFHDVQIKGGGDATSAARAVFQTGEADYAWNLQVESQVLNQLSQGGKANLVTALSPNVERLLVNFSDPNPDLGDNRGEPSTKHPFLSDLNVRKALAMAVDRKSIAEQLYGPAGAATCNIITSPPDVVSKNTDTMDVCQNNIDMANQLLDQAGWTKGSDGIRQKDGVRMHIVYQTTVNSLRQKEQDIVKSSWEKLGVEVELKSVDASVFFSSDAGNPDTAAHFYTDIEMFTNGGSWPDQTQYVDLWTTDQIAAKANQWHGNNYSRWSNSDYDAIYNQLKTETDQTKRRDLIIKANDLLVSNVVVIPLVARTQPTDGISKDIQGEVPNPWDSVLWQVADWHK